VSTIKSSREIDSVFRKSTRIAHPQLIALMAPTPEGRGREGRVAFIAGKRIGNAVARNRAKRVMRAAVRRARGPWPGYDVLFIANATTGTADPSALDEAMRRFVERAGAKAPQR